MNDTEIVFASHSKGELESPFIKVGTTQWQLDLNVAVEMDWQEHRKKCWGDGTSPPVFLSVYFKTVAMNKSLTETLILVVDSYTVRSVFFQFDR